MSNRNFDSRVIIQRLQDRNQARNMYLYNTTGQRIINNSQTTNGDISKMNNYNNGSQTMYFRGLLGGCDIVSVCGNVNIPPYPTQTESGIDPTPPAPGWATSIIGGGFEDQSNSIAVDLNGNIYVTGYYSSNPLIINSFNSISGGNINVKSFGNLSNSGGVDCFIIKYNSSGTVQWATSITGTGDEEGNGIAVDTAGNIYVTGIYGTNPVTINSFSSIFEENVVLSSFGTMANSGSVNCFIVKFNTNGIAQWATRVGGTGSDRGLGMAVDTSGNVYVTGQYSSNPLTVNSFNSKLDGNIIVTSFGNLSNSGGQDCFIVKYDTNGNAKWATRVGGTGSDRGLGIAVDINENVYITGAYFTNPVAIYSFNSVLDGNIIVSYFGSLSISSGAADCFILKYNPIGEAQWATSVGGSGGNEQGFGIVVDANFNVYITGQYFSSPVTINSFSSVSNGNVVVNSFGNLSRIGSPNCFVVKYNKNGKAEWATSISGNSQGNSIEVDISGNVYVTGQYSSNPVTINSFSTVSGGNIIVNSFGNLANFGSSDCFIVKYNSVGAATWATRIGGTGFDQGNSIAVDTTGNLYVTGRYSSNPVTINSFSSVSGGNVNVTPYGNLARIGGYDCFIVKYKTDGTI
jgi:hypothetical protein